MSKTTRRSEGRTVGALLVLLVLLVGLGGWNYHRNMQSEAAQEAPRPFRGYASADLEALQAAYSQEIAVYQKKYAAQDSRRQRAADTGLIDERVEAFGRVQQTSGRLRELRADLADREARLREIEVELRERSTRLSGLSLHLQRLLTI